MGGGEGAEFGEKYSIDKPLQELIQNILKTIPFDPNYLGAVMTADGITLPEFGLKERKEYRAGCVKEKILPFPNMCSDKTNVRDHSFKERKEYIATCLEKKIKPFSVTHIRIEENRWKFLHLDEDYDQPFLDLFKITYEPIFQSVIEGGRPNKIVVDAYFTKKNDYKKFREKILSFLLEKNYQFERIIILKDFSISSLNIKNEGITYEKDKLYLKLEKPDKKLETWFESLK